MIPDNSISSDIIAVRAERLPLIEMYLATHLPVLLEVDSQLAARLSNCSTACLQKKEIASLADGGSASRAS